MPATPRRPRTFLLSLFLSVSTKNQAVYNYPVLREALNVMSQVPAADQQDGGSKEIPLLLMRTVLESVQRFPELKNFVATVVLVRLVQHRVSFCCDSLSEVPACRVAGNRREVGLDETASCCCLFWCMCDLASRIGRWAWVMNH